jgi:hypothetical protein
MKFLNSKQLAFILDIEVQEAREKMVYAHCKANGLSVPQRRKKEDLADAADKKSKKDYINYAEYPIAVSIEILSDKLNIPTLQQSVNDIEANYLTRPASKKWILCDYPEKKIKSFAESGGRHKLSLPGALASLLPKATQDVIMQEWRARFPKWTV